MTPDDLDRWIRDIYWQTWASHRTALFVVVALSVSAYLFFGRARLEASYR